MSDRSHNQGRQGREFTPAQKAAVDRVKRCKAYEYYAILDIEVSANDGEIKKAYRKLALIMHPDKNGAPGADEAFKLVSKAFQVLSDPQKKRIFDQTGSDPESRGMGGATSSGYSRGGGMSGGGFHGGPEVSAEDLFNMFFGGGAGAAGFGGPNIRVHTFGGGGSPFDAFNAFSQGRAGHGAGRQGAAPNQPQEPFSLRHLMQLLPLLLLFLAPMLTSLFGSSESSSNLYNRYRFSPEPPYTVEKHTPRYRIPFYVREADEKLLDRRRLNQVGDRAEVVYVQNLRNKCDREYEFKQRKIAESQGWFFVDQQKYDEAMGLKLQSCDRLTSLGIRTGIY